METEGDVFLVKTEGDRCEVNPEMVQKMRELFHSSVTIEVITPGSLNYDGHGRRFTQEE